MSRNRTSFVNRLLAVSALGATAGVMAWRWSQRHGAQRAGHHRDLTRWEGEGGSVDDASGASAASAAPGSVSPVVATGASGAADGNDASQMPWPFPHGNA